MKEAEDKPVGCPEALEKSMLPLVDEEILVVILCKDRYVPEDTLDSPASPLDAPMPKVNRLLLLLSVVPM